MRGRTVEGERQERPDTCAGDLLKDRQTSKAHRFSRTPQQSRADGVLFVETRAAKYLLPAVRARHTGCNRLFPPLSLLLRPPATG